MLARRAGILASVGKFFRWRDAFAKHGKAGPANARPVPRSHPNQILEEVVEKVLYLRRKYRGRLLESRTNAPVLNHIANRFLAGI